MPDQEIKQLKHTTPHGEFVIRPSTDGDADSILEMLSKAPDALLTVALPEILKWINNGWSFVATNENGGIVGHQGMHYWGDNVGGTGVVEIRSAYVDPMYRKNGLNTQMKNLVLKVAKNQYPQAKIIGFTEAASGSRHVLQRLGFEPMDFPQVPEELYSICPPDICDRGGSCGCIVYELKKNIE